MRLTLPQSSRVQSQFLISQNKPWMLSTVSELLGKKLLSVLVCETVRCVAGHPGGFGMSVSVCYWGGKGMPRGSVTCPSCRFLTSWASQRLVVESSFSTWANVVSFSWSGRHWRRASLALRDAKYDLCLNMISDLPYFDWSLHWFNWNDSATQTGF